MRFTIPIRLPSLNNARMNWRAMVALKAEQKAATKVFMTDHMNRTGEIIPDMPLLVMLTRIGPQQMDDDNLAGACKYVRDQIATIIGVDDGSSLYNWQYKQRLGKVYSVEVEIIPRPTSQ